MCIEIIREKLTISIYGMKRIIRIHNNLVHQISLLSDEAILNVKFTQILKNNDTDQARRQQYESETQEFFANRTDPYARIYKKIMSAGELSLFKKCKDEAILKSIEISNFENKILEVKWMNQLPQETRMIIKLDNIEKLFKKCTPDHFTNLIPHQEKDDKMRNNNARRRVLYKQKKLKEKKEKRQVIFKAKSLTKEQTATTIVTTATCVKTHYDGKSKQPNDKQENQIFLQAWKRQWLGKKPLRIVGRWITRAEIPHTNETVLQGSWGYKADRVYSIIGDNLEIEFRDLYEMVEESRHMIDQIGEVIVDRIAHKLRRKLEENKINEEEFDKKMQSQLRGNKSIKSKLFTGKPIKPRQILNDFMIKQQFLQQAIDRHNTEQPESKPHSQKTKYEFNGVKKPNDIQKYRSVKSFRKERTKLEEARAREYLGRRRIRGNH